MMMTLVGGYADDEKEQYDDNHDHDHDRVGNGPGDGGSDDEEGNAYWHGSTNTVPFGIASLPLNMDTSSFIDPRSSGCSTAPTQTSSHHAAV